MASRTHPERFLEEAQIWATEAELAYLLGAVAPAEERDAYRVVATTESDHQYSEGGHRETCIQLLKEGRPLLISIRRTTWETTLDDSMDYGAQTAECTYLLEEDAAARQVFTGVKYWWRLGGRQDPRPGRGWVFNDPALPLVGAPREHWAHVIIERAECWPPQDDKPFKESLGACGEVGLDAELLTPQEACQRGLVPCPECSKVMIALGYQPDGSDYDAGGMSSSHAGLDYDPKKYLRPATVK